MSCMLLLMVIRNKRIKKSVFKRYFRLFSNTSQYSSQTPSQEFNHTGFFSYLCNFYISHALYNQQSLSYDASSQTPTRKNDHTILNQYIAYLRNFYISHTLYN